ncbi:MAG: S41 family peptidase [Desulfobacterales bacterium]|nr:S41 family peptidase [Desulfobacterales bacterium]
MRTEPKGRTKIWVILALAAVLWTAGSAALDAAGSDETYKGLKLFTDVLEIVTQKYVDEVDTGELIQKAIQGMVHSLDPHSSLLPPDAFEDLRIDTKGNFTGIGIHITLRNGFVTVISPIEGTPASKAGIRAQDRIVMVDGKRVNDLRQAVKLMRGPKGTPVKVTVIRQGEQEPLEFSLIRDVIPVKSIKAHVLKPGFGYIWITNFTGNTTDDFLEALEKIESENGPLKGLVLDLRNNGGGLLEESLEISDIFIDEGAILSIKGRNPANTRVFNASPNKVPRDYPIVVLINGGSASASEIVAGALQDHKRGLILGTTSFGKGSVQTVETLREGYGLKLTIARYYTPNGRSIQAKGIEPDIIVPYKPLEEPDDENGDDGFLKERDLQNHLDAADAPEKDKQNDKEQSGIGDVEFRVNPLEMENLKRDNQIMRALDILVSYNLFSGLRE